MLPQNIGFDSLRGDYIQFHLVILPNETRTKTTQSDPCGFFSFHSDIIIQSGKETQTL